MLRLVPETDRGWPMARRRKTVARHARLDSPSIARQLVSIIAVAVAVVLVAGAGTVAYAAYGLITEVGESAVELEDQPAEPPGLGAYGESFSMLLVGTDECEPELIERLGDRCTGPDATGQRNDVNMLVHVSKDPRRVTVVSFPRDLEIPVPACRNEDGSELPAMSKQPINSVYGHGGLPCVAQTVSQLSGLDIPFAAKVSFGNVIAITEAIGGVEVCIGNQGMSDDHTGIDWPPGPRTIQGEEALQFLRTRHGVGDESDLARIGNQQQYMSSLARKLTSPEVLSDPAALLRLATAAAENIEPSESLVNPLRMAQLALAATDAPLNEITFLQFPVVDDPANRNHVVTDTSAAPALWEALAQNQPLQVTGDVGRGVIEATPQSTPPATQTPAPDPTTSAAPDPTETPVELSQNVPGSKADQATCSNSRLR